MSIERETRDVPDALSFIHWLLYVIRDCELTSTGPLIIVRLCCYKVSHGLESLHARACMRVCAYAALRGSTGC